MEKVSSKSLSRGALAGARQKPSHSRRNVASAPSSTSNVERRDPPPHQQATLVGLPNDILEVVASKLDPGSIVQTRATHSLLRAAVPKPDAQVLAAFQAEKFLGRLTSACNMLSRGTGDFGLYREHSQKSSLDTIATSFGAHDISYSSGNCNFDVLPAKVQKAALKAWKGAKLDLHRFLSTPSEDQQKVLNVHKTLLALTSVKIPQDPNLSPETRKALHSQMTRLHEILCRRPFRETFFGFGQPLVHPDGLADVIFRDERHLEWARGASAYFCQDVSNAFATRVPDLETTEKVLREVSPADKFWRSRRRQTPQLYVVPEPSSTESNRDTPFVRLPTRKKLFGKKAQLVEHVILRCPLAVALQKQAQEKPPAG